MSVPYQVIWAPDWAKGDYRPAFFDGRYLYRVSMSQGLNHFIVFDVRTEQFVAGGSLTPTNPNAGPTGLLVEAYRRKFGATLKIVTTDTGKLYIDRVDIDVSGNTATVTNELNVSNSDILNNQTYDSHVIGDSISFTFSGSPYIVFVDPYTGATQKKIDTGFGSYRPRTGQVFSVKGDDLYVLVGRHYAGDPFRLLKVYAGTLTTIPNSTVGGDSPHTWRATVYVCRNIKLFTGTGFSVVDSQPPIRWFNPQNFSVIGSTSLTSIYSTARVLGYYPIGEDDTYIHIVAGIWDNTWNYETRRSLHLIRVNKTDLSFAGHTQIATFDYRFELITCQQRTFAPILDRQKKILYTMFSRSFYDDQFGILKLDLSQYLDYYNVTDFNEVMYYVGEYRKPTSLYMNVTVV
ncbi:MAG: hypothetical protein QXN57_05680 [Desulfurococcaceae archaeon]